MNIANYDAFLAIADANRREILMMLSRREQTVSSIAQNFDISRPAISRHLRVLKTTGFISIEEKGRERLCKLNKDGFNEISEWMSYFENFWMSQLENLDEFLKANQSLNSKKSDK